MIKFFRKIRQNLLTENKLSKYLIYAIGEIVLVVIGILIALQINNNNSFKEQRKVEQEYLISLQSEFETNLNKINNSIQENDERIQALEMLLTLFDKNVLDTVSQLTISKKFNSVFGNEIYYFPSTGVLSDIISSGKLNIILNKKLTQHLASFESHLNFLNLQVIGAKETDEALRKFLYQKGSVRKIVMDLGIVDFKRQSISEGVNNKQLFDSAEFENYILDYLLLAKATNGSLLFGGIKSEIEIILVEIERELKK